MVIIGFLLAALVGISLGLIGSGGSILTVPILVYVMGVDPVLATAYSLFIVGSTALVGGVQSALQKRVDFKTVLIFGIPSIAAVYATRLWLVPLIPAEIVSISGLVITKPIALMLLFAVVMILASVSMIRPGKKSDADESAPMVYNYPMILLEGAIVGVLTGLVGAGGGFLIIPALVLLAKMPMKLAVGTSLFIIAAKSLIGFTGDLQGSQVIDWKLLLTFTAFAVIGIFGGIILSKKIPGEKLKKAFGWFVLVMGIYIIVKELFFPSGSGH
ncbi:MAG TPA: sulfite exporter TauE/SafE family protein [Sediminibacterium sp.]|uniref:sulfite exporter TauE/SafE family protein n=1 Tax=Sediminibacterium sp. TaxID=1917865 RepID=UPI0008C0623C|nr:sulfite exporter TauE/SafE family protein [Sediminibacterium sp.]MBT9484806.1 sulfite exporter TauE/SafE family protein [Sediminibacterium sp.]OHC85044.1 MAG: permease [Sphingobacteriia bacterium RIFOXYC2_FULL_35_18]OHC87094.1 MAG: permease [Sphingobacteriia bacterium RIFOXYD2_FULL_35_12]HLD52287.1 sulfite exporter TauE/SafE family protein [Sediminibacterium sp.]